jgi:hypothetical protein
MVLAWIQSKRHCREVLEHMGVDIPKGDSAMDKVKREEQNKHYLIEYLEVLGVGMQEWKKWHDDLPDVAQTSPTDSITMRRSPADYAKQE